MTDVVLRQVKRQLEMFLEDGELNRVIVCLALIDSAFPSPVRVAAARTAVTASKKTGRSVDPRVAELAEPPSIPIVTDEMLVDRLDILHQIQRDLVGEE